MTAVFSDELRARVEADFGRVVDLLGRKVALKSISAEGITAEHMKRSAEFVADELRQVGIDAKVVQSRNPDGTPGAWEVIGSKIVDPQAPTVLLYAHHDVQPVPDPSAWDTDPFVATEVGTRLYGRGSADDGGGIAIHSGAMKALGDDLKVNIKVFVEGEEEMGSPSFIPFIEDHRDEFASDVIVVADSGNWSAEIPSLTTSLRGNTCVDVNVSLPAHPTSRRVQLMEPGGGQAGVHARHAQLVRRPVHPPEAVGQIRLPVEAVIAEDQIVPPLRRELLPLGMEGGDIVPAALRPGPEDEVQYVPGEIHAGHLPAQLRQGHGIAAPAGPHLQGGLHPAGPQQGAQALQHLEGGGLRGIGLACHEGVPEVPLRLVVGHPGGGAGRHVLRPLPGEVGHGHPLPHVSPPPSQWV